MYELFDDVSEPGLKVQAQSLPELFVDAARGLTALMIASLEDIEPEQEIAFQIAGDLEELEYLLFDWLNEILYLFDTEEILLCEFDVEVTQEGLQATGRGERLDPARHRLAREINAISYDSLDVEQQGKMWVAEVTVKT